MRPPHETACEHERFEPYSDPPEEEADDGELDEIDPDDPRWEPFIADDEERNPEPEYGDFWPTE